MMAEDNGQTKGPVSQTGNTTGGGDVINADSVDKSEHHHYPEGYKGPQSNLATAPLGQFRFNPQIMKEVVEEMDSKLSDLELDEHPINDFSSIDVAKKNELNRLTQAYYDENIKLRYEPFFNRLEGFLKSRENRELTRKIDRLSAHLGQRILANESKYEAFEHLLLDIENGLLEHSFEELNTKDFSLSLLINYLYVQCLIGRKE
ncbi:MAG: hypothetical protein H6988_03065 [Pseudomonadales bacterium]|nr:hypothetical protein [Pseudomonadales bacterium]